ncbi:MAG: DNA replication/repair protein RecF [Armatimonadetes bacterium]|nr:DNA replication/repair protein RecF [Armatimonadota bacterium]
MHLLELFLRNFRNYRRAEVRLERGINVFVGHNAQGKSNLLEAVYLCATGRSHRTQRDEEMIRAGEDRAVVRCRAAGGLGEETLEVRLGREDGEPVAKEFRVNGMEVERGELLGRLPVILSSPLDLDIIRGAAGARRRFLDGMLSQLSPAYYFTLLRYARVLQQRNRLLRQGHAGGMEAWDEQMVALGTVLAARRHAAVTRLAPRATRIYGEIVGGREELVLTYRPVWEGSGEEEISAAGRRALAAVRALERQRGTSLSGPHRDDLTVVAGGMELRAFGSQGQQRAAALAGRLAEWELLREDRGEDPVLLLDDVLAELDDRRQAYLLDRVARGAQALLTTTAVRETAVPLPAIRRFWVVSGTVEETAGDVRTP